MKNGIVDRSMAAASFLLTLGGFLALQSALCAAREPDEEALEFLNLHNEARATVGVRPLRWDKGLAVLASIFAALPAEKDHASCDLSRATKATQPSLLGLNQALKNVVSPASEVMKSWVDVGRQSYDYESNTCAQGYQNRCDSYTQVVWSKTNELGCAKAGCGKDGSVTICLYNPRGNTPGEKPY